MKAPQKQVIKAMIWRAVSSKKQAADDKISLTKQGELGHEVANSNNWRVIIELVVDGYSRSITRIDKAITQVGGYQVVNGEQTPCQPYGVLCDLIESRAIDVLIFFDMDRLGRSTVLAQVVLQLCRDFGVKYYDISSPTPFDAQDTEGAMYTSAFGGIRSAVYIKRLQDSHRTGMMQRIKRGHFPAGIPWGWLGKWAEGVDGKKVLQAVEVDPVASAHIRTILLDWYFAQGMTQKAIAQRLNSLGIATASGLTHWEQSSIANMFELIWRYAGYSETNRRSQNREYVKAKGNWPSIISEQEAEMLLAEIARRADAPRTVSHVKLFSGVVICARCDHVMSVQKDIGYGSSLRCENVVRFGAHNDGTLKKGTVSHNTLMMALHADLLGLQNRTTRSAILAAAKKNANTDASQEQLDAIEARLKRLEAAQQRIDYDYYIEERIDTQRHAALSADIARQVKEAEQQRDQLRHKLNEQYSHEHFAESLADTAQHGLERLAWPVREANAWLRQTLRIYVQNCAVVEIKYLPPNYML